MIISRLSGIYRKRSDTSTTTAILSPTYCCLQLESNSSSSAQGAQDTTGHAQNIRLVQECSAIANATTQPSKLENIQGNLAKRKKPPLMLSSGLDRLNQDNTKWILRKMAETRILDQYIKDRYPVAPTKPFDIRETGDFRLRPSKAKIAAMKKHCAKLPLYGRLPGDQRRMIPVSGDFADGSCRRSNTHTLPQTTKDCSTKSSLSRACR